MANDIARQFQHLPADEATEAVAGHLRQFWDPRMRRRITELVRAGAPDLDPVAAQAVGRLAG